ncbi:MAG: sterol desaturase family protein [Verrucomicrobiales bacterium]|nr:sterol desaturase family protein [Verrucomicrobiales bacterium]
MSDWWQLPLAVGASLLFLAVVFIPLERCFSARKQRVFRPGWWTDLFFLLGQYLVWSGLVLTALHAFQTQLHALVPAAFRENIAAQPWWLQALGMVALSDFLIYWGHRLQHRWSFLWRFHSIHHSAEHLDWLAAHREHPLDTIYTMGIINLPAFILGFPLETLAGFLAFRGLWAIYIHSNVRLSHRWVRWLIGAPELHHWHHDRARDAGNYANLSPMMDRIFGTYRCPDHEPEAFGIPEKISPSYLGQLLHPFRRRPKNDR